MARLFSVESFSSFLKLTLFFRKKRGRKKGERGIRTLDSFKNYAGFQDRSHKPLGHLSYFLSKKIRSLIASLYNNKNLFNNIVI
jgi:hypothetical protein